MSLRLFVIPPLLLFLGLLFLALLFPVLLLLASDSRAADYVGAQQCAGCHQQALQDWQGSHHDWAMKIASPETVLGDFNNATFSHQGVTSTFSTKEGGYYVNTQGADG